MLETPERRGTQQIDSIEGLRRSVSSLGDLNQNAVTPTPKYPEKTCTREIQEIDGIEDLCRSLSSSDAPTMTKKVRQINSVEDLRCTVGSLGQTPNAKLQCQNTRKIPTPERQTLH